MEERFDLIDKRFDKVKLEIREKKVEMANNQTENRSHFRHMEERLDQQ